MHNVKSFSQTQLLFAWFISKTSLWFDLPTLAQQIPIQNHTGVEQTKPPSREW
jgi:hypothetical protein